MKRAKANMVYGCDYSDIWISGFKRILRSLGFELNFKVVHIKAKKKKISLLLKVNPLTVLDSNVSMLRESLHRE